MFAVVRTGGKQYKVSPGDLFDVEKLDGEPGDSLVLREVLAVGEDGRLTIGAPHVAKAEVACTIVRQFRGDKIVVFKFKAKKRYRRTQGHRQSLTTLRVERLLTGDESRPPVPTRAKAARGPAAAPAKPKAAPKLKAAAKPAAKAAAKPKSTAKAAAVKKPAAKLEPPVQKTKAAVKSAAKSKTSRK